MNRRDLLQSMAAAALVPPAKMIAAAKPAAMDVDVTRPPDLVRAATGVEVDSISTLVRSGDRWSGAGVEVTCRNGVVSVSTQGVRLRRIHLRWRGRAGESAMVLGDAWERSYGDLAWLPVQAERPLPWYCLVRDASATHGFGVETGASSFAWWQVDTEGVSLWLDTRNGGNGVDLRDRPLELATIVSVTGGAAFATARDLCRKMARNVVLAKQRGGYSLAALYGSNDWYYAYGKNSPEGILRDADTVREVSPSGGVRPFTVIDDGYQDPKHFPSMPRLAEEIRRREVNPGVWVRPLRAPASAKASWLLPAARFARRKERAGDLAYDPTVPDARRAALDVVREAKQWGYGLIKHDFTTYELLGAWGNEMGPSPTADGWSFADTTKTSAEILRDFYRDIRQAAGEDRIVIGCNTVGHLAAGIFDAQRTGDDVSGRLWERTRRMGVNTLAFRLPQHGVFFAIDADCVPVTRDIPWALTRQWLKAVADTGSVLLISPEPGSMGPEQKTLVREAFASLTAGRLGQEPSDWLQSRTPAVWGKTTYDWLGPEGASPFPA